MELGIVKPVGIVDQMTEAYLDYSMSVIVSRALPDVRDGLKPVHRRVLYAMDQMGLQANRSFRKSAGIVGEVLKEYHPHSDAAVYDTLVRLVQPWALRYPLALGQGNWGCFTGDTKIALLDGTEKSFAELAQHPPDQVFHVYAVDANGNIVVGEGRNARITRKNAELVEVTLDSGAKIRCTPDHQVMLRDGTYKEAQHLTPSDSLMPGYFDTAPVREGMNAYLRIMQPATGEFAFVHHLADAFNVQRGQAKPFVGPFVRHHKNFSRFDNRPTNIERMAFLEHLHLHSQRAHEMWLDPQFRAAQRAGVHRYYAKNPHMREFQRQRLIRRNQDAAFRQANRQRTSERMQAHFATNPQARTEFGDRMRALWQDAEYRERMSQALRGIEKRPLTAEQRREVARIVSQKSREMWGNEEKRAEIVAAIVKAMANEAVRNKLSLRAQAAWRNPSYRAKYGDDHFSRMAQALWSRPETRQFHRMKIARQWDEPAFREAQRAGVQASNERRLMARPQLMHELAKKAAVSLQGKWHDGDAHRRTVMRQKIAGYAAGVLADIPREQFTAQTFDLYRHSNWIPRWEKASQYFESFDELLEVAVRYNHRVVSVRRLDEREDVYDITVDDHHNFLLADGVFVHNSIDDDPAAAMRYTESKMSAIAAEILADIDKDTVDFIPNYDGHSQEPSVLPARLPNLLLNGSAGIAVGMATNIPPHNLREVCDGINYLVDHPEATIEDLGRIIRGPDFPTGGIIQGREGIRSAYTTGRGRIVVRAKAHTEETERGKLAIIVTELPYQVNKADLVKKISELARDKKVDGITDVRDESDRAGIRVVIELRRDARHMSVINQLFKYTAMQTTFGANMLALVDGQPRTLTLKQILQHYIAYREQVITRRTRHELAKAEARKHILEGLTTALDHLDAVIETIRRSQNRETASSNLRKAFGLSEEQAKAILDMQLGRLAALERKKIIDELAEVKHTISGLQRILANIGEVRALIKQDMVELKDKYGDPRRTEIVESEATDFTEEDLIPNDEVVVMLTQGGYIKRMATSAYRAQRRGGRGSRGMTTHEDDTVRHLLSTRAHDSLLFFTNRGRVFQLKAYGLPDVGKTAKGEHIRNLIGIDQEEAVTAVVSVPKFLARDYMVMATKRGEVKKTSMDEFAVVRSLGLIAMDLEPGDELIGAKMVGATDTVLLITEHGQAIRFAAQELRAASRMSGGVRGIRLDTGDQVVALVYAKPKAELLVVTTHGYGKRTPIEEYPTHGRGGGGIITARLTDKTGVIAAARILTEEDRDLMIISAEGTVIRTDWHTVAQSGRPTQGVRLMNMQPGDRVVACATLFGEDDEEVGEPAEE